MKFCIDSDSILYLFRHFPEAVFGSLWSNIDGLISSGALFSSEMVHMELERGDDEVVEILKSKNTDFFLPVDAATLKEMETFVPKYPDSIEHEKDREQADPYLICLAKISGATVITEERAKGISQGMKLTKIPNICQLEGISCTNFQGMMQSLKWQF